MAKFYKEVYVRAHSATPPSTYAGLASGWTKYDTLIEKNTINQQPKVQDQLADGTAYTSTEETPIDFTVHNATGTSYAAMRSLMLNALVDVLYVDPDQLAASPYLESVRLYPQVMNESGAVMKVQVTGSREASVNSPAQSYITLT
jgi:hypothetical protein